MKKKLVRFVIVSAVFTTTLFFGSLLFDLIDKKESDVVREIKEALAIGVLTSFFLVFLTNFFKKRDEI